MKAFILAGGFGIRLREVIHGRPKVLAPIHGRPFLEYVIRYLKREGIEQIVLGVGYLSHYVRDAFGNGRSLGVQIDYSEELRPLGTAGAIRNAAHLLDNDFLVLNGDTLVDVNLGELMRLHRDRQADVTLVATRTHHGRGGLMQVDAQGRVVRFDEQPVERPVAGYTNAGVYVFNPKILELLRQGERSFLESDLFPQLLEQEFRVAAFIGASDYIDIGSPERYERAKKMLRSIDANG